MQMPRYEQIELGMTVIEMTDHLKARGVDLASAILIYREDGFYFVFFFPETDEEWEQRLKKLDEADARREARRIREIERKERNAKIIEAAERAEYERLKTKFEPGGSD